MSNVLCKSNKDIPKDMLLGNLSFINITDMQIPESGLVSIFQSNNIPEDYVRKISKADAFRRASSSVKNKVIWFTDTNTGSMIKAKIEVDEVKSDSDGVKRIIGFKAVDEKNEDISYTPMGYISFARDTEQVVYGIEPQYINEQDVVTIFEDISNRYTDWSMYHNKDTVRNIINRIVGDTHPISLMPTGLCKFIPNTSTDLLYNLKEALTEMSSYSINGGAVNTMEIIPIIDTEEQRELIEKNFSAEITEELFGFTQELKDVLAKKQTLSTRTATSYIEKFKLLKEKAKEYESLLGVYVNSIHDQISASLDLVNDNIETDSDV